MHFYVDGSCIKSSVGAGIACFIENEEGMYHVGCLSKFVEAAGYAFQGEHAAMTWALLWAIQISTWHFKTYAAFDVQFHFNFDALNTGYQTAGYW